MLRQLALTGNLTATAITLAVMLLPGTGSTASAAVHFSYAAGHASYSLSPGEEVGVTLLLIEQRDSAGDPSILVAENGLLGFDVRVERQSGAALITDAVANTAEFDFAFDAYAPARPFGGVSTAEFSVGSLDDPGPTGSENGLLRIFELGTVTIHAPSTIGETSTFSILDSTLGTNTVTNALTALDPLIGAGAFSVQTIPEPATLVLIGHLMILATQRPRRT